MPPNWTTEHWLNFVINILAALALIALFWLIKWAVLERVFGDKPALKISVSETDRDHVGYDWPHLVIANMGLWLSPRTRAARLVSVCGKLDGRDVWLLWSATTRDCPEQMDIYEGRPRKVPLIATAKTRSAAADLYGNSMEVGHPYLTDAEFMSQGSRREIEQRLWFFRKRRLVLVKRAPERVRLTSGRHVLEIDAQSIEGHRVSERFEIEVPVSGGFPIIRRATP